ARIVGQAPPRQWCRLPVCIQNARKLKFEYPRGNLHFPGYMVYMAFVVPPFFVMVKSCSVFSSAPNFRPTLPEYRFFACFVRWSVGCSVRRCDVCGPVAFLVFDPFGSRSF